MPKRKPLHPLFSRPAVLLGCLLALALLATACAAPLVNAVRGLVDSDSIRAELFNDGAVDLDIRFASGSAQILPESLPQLDEAAEALKDIDQEKYVLLVVGHTDSTGDAAMNKALSLKRAKAVIAYLRDKKGYPWWFLSARGMGEEELKVSPEATAEDKAANRRVELRLEEAANG